MKHLRPAILLTVFFVVVTGFAFPVVIWGIGQVAFADQANGSLVKDAHGKVVGSAQVRRGGAFLQHGSILLDGSQDVVSAVSRQPAAVSATTLSHELGRPVHFDEVAAAIVEAWGEIATRAAAVALPPSLPFSDPAWIWRR
jgi:lipoate-protein ligase A